MLFSVCRVKYIADKYGIYIPYAYTSNDNDEWYCYFKVSWLFSVHNIFSPFGRLHLYTTIFKVKKILWAAVAAIFILAVKDWDFFEGKKHFQYDIT